MPRAQVTPVYRGRAEITFWPVQHYYTVSVPGVCTRLYQPSVTTILKLKDKSDALLPWAVNQMEKRIKEIVATCSDLSKDDFLAIVSAAKDSYRNTTAEAGDIGTVVHAALEQELMHRSGLAPKPLLPLTLDPIRLPDFDSSMIQQANDAISAGFRFFAEHTIKVRQTEAPRWSAQFGYIGTGDVIWELDGSPVVGDFKTAKRIYPEVWMQTAAYQVAYQEEYEDRLDGRVAVHVGKDGSLDHKSRENDTLKEDFQAFLSLRRVWDWTRKNIPRWDRGKRSYVYDDVPRVLGNLDRLLEEKAQEAV